MAEVLRPLVPSDSPLSIGQQGQTSNPDAKPRASTSQQSHIPPRLVQMPRNNGPHNHASGGTGYRGTAAAPTYAFKATPSLQTQPKSPNQQQNVSQSQPPNGDGSNVVNRQRYPAAPSVSTTSSSTTSSNPSSTPSHTAASTWSSLFSKNDSTFSSNFEVAPFTAGSNPKDNSNQEPVPDSTSDAFPPLSEATALTDLAPKQAPGRYRRGQKRMGTNPTLPEAKVLPTPTTKDLTIHPPSSNGQTPKLTTAIPSSEIGTKDLDKDVAALSRTDSIEPQASAGAEQSNGRPSISSLNRYRRRSSVNTLDSAGKGKEGSDAPKSAPSASSSERPSSPSRAAPAQPNQRPSSPSRAAVQSNRTDGSSGPARTFAEVARRTNTPSPLSRPMTPDQSSNSFSPSSPPAGLNVGRNDAFQSSPAVAAMAALSEKENQRGVKSRLRRAFSFGSSAELNRVQEGIIDPAKSRAQVRREQFSSELDEEQATIARQQEAAGLGESIYSGQAGFVGSTDNLSISSTASSASMMLRKMGKGMKKGGRSIKGLFRPKSAIGVAPPDGPLGASIGEVSRVTVEAEREKVNINVDPRDQAGGGTGFPKLERNSFDAVRASVSDERRPPLESLDNRRSIVGGESDRAEVLASVKRSILKRSTTGSPNGSPRLKPADAPLTNHDNPSLERHVSPSTSIGSNEATKATITSSHDYFSRIPKAGNQSSRSLPGTPKSAAARNISFSPRIQFYDVWSATEYDRRGDIATCNRLTPMLAQQIKEELNTFKMEMEVHESSKPHTHFF